MTEAINNLLRQAQISTKLGGQKIKLNQII